MGRMKEGGLLDWWAHIPRVLADCIPIFVDVQQTLETTVDMGSTSDFDLLADAALDMNLMSPNKLSTSKDLSFHLPQLPLERAIC